MAPYDFLVADAALSEREVAAARAAAGMWTAEHAYPLLPWSCIVLESIPEEHQPSMPHSLQAASPLSSALKPVPAADAFARSAIERSASAKGASVCPCCQPTSVSNGAFLSTVALEEISSVEVEAA